MKKANNTKGQKRLVSVTLAEGKAEKTTDPKGQKKLLSETLAERTNDPKGPLSVTLAEGKAEKTNDPRGQKKPLSATLAEGKVEKTNDPNCTDVDGNLSFVKVNQQSHKKITGETSIRKPNFPPKKRKSKASVSTNLASKGAQIGERKTPTKSS